MKILLVLAAVLLTPLGCEPNEADACDAFGAVAFAGVPAVSTFAVHAPIATAVAVPQAFIVPQVSAFAVASPFVSTFAVSSPFVQTVAVASPVCSLGGCGVGVSAFGINRVQVLGGGCGVRSRSLSSVRINSRGRQRSLSRSSIGGIFGRGFFGGSRSTARVVGF